MDVHSTRMATKAILKTYSETKVYFTSAAMTKAREALGMSQEEFANYCGWTQQNQQQLELPGIKHCLDDEKRRIFHSVGITIKNRS